MIGTTTPMTFHRAGPQHTVNRNLIKTFVATISVAAWAGAEPLLTHTDVFVSGQSGYHTYRIPAVEAAPDGSLIAFAEARKYNAADPGFGTQEIDLVYKRSTNNGTTWSPMTVLEPAGELWSAANPNARKLNRLDREDFMLGGATLIAGSR